MVRPLRIAFAGALYHVISRGNERKPLVRDDADRVQGRWGRWWLAGCLVLACALGSGSLLSTAVPVPGVHGPAGIQSIAHASVAIERIRVGQRVVAENPDPASSARTALVEVDAATWRLLRLRAEERWADGTLDVIEAETLQPPDWLQQHGAQPGSRVPLPLDLVEMGLPETLQARVVANEACPPIPPGPGCVVLTTVNHLNPNLYALTLENSQGHQETVRPTGLHKFYSADRQSWVNTQDLKQGEPLRGLSGWLRVVRCVRVAGVHRVYNMTVAGEHVFHVSSLGLLSHNNHPCADLAPSRTIVLGENSARLQKFADTIPGGHVYQPRRPFTVEKNVDWLRRQIKDGARIYDLGLDVSRPRGHTPFYLAEEQFLRSRGFARQFRGLVEVEGRTLRLFEWVR